MVLLDIWLPDRDGLDALADIRRMDSEHLPEVVIISGHGTIEAAVRATKLGAYDFLEKPLSLDRTLMVLKNAMKRDGCAKTTGSWCGSSASRGVTGNSVPMKALRQQIKLMAPTNGRVLIYGESGTGKELIGRAMHAESLRKDRVFVELNCAAIPEDHIETELFGYRRGACQPGSAPPEKRGTFERADGGTLFLDEVGDMSLKTQAKVLRALDEQRFLPVGGYASVARRRARDRRDQQGSGRGDRARQLPRRPVLSAQCDSVLCAAAARSQGRHSAAGEGVSAGVRPAVWPSACGDACATHSKRFGSTTGRAMCASCAISSSAC